MAENVNPTKALETGLNYQQQNAAANGEAHIAEISSEVRIND